ncbi:unnamed protein product [Polarella glacialis]|uniref:Large ribosomal subunit protein uL22c n=1 Tax=Polarella glacialis TaxID=89957 RepID=A0A813L0P9_POLGL|nr:unnamed protein product [Polarella glacialis]
MVHRQRGVVALGLLAVIAVFESAHRSLPVARGAEDFAAFLVPPPQNHREPRAAFGGVATFAPEASSVSCSAAFGALAFGALVLAASVRRHVPSAAAARRSLHAVQLRAEGKASAESEDEEEDEQFEGDESGTEYEDSEDDEEEGSSAQDDSWLYADGEEENDGEDEEKLEARCRARYLNGSPQKYRRVLWQIRGRSYREALMLLEFMPWRHCKPCLVALQSAASNAQNHFNMDKSRLYVSKCRADNGPTSKRMRPVSKGQAHPYKRRTTHLTVIVSEMDDAMLAKQSQF